MYIVKVFNNVPYKTLKGSFFTSNLELLENILPFIECNYDSWSVEENEVRFIKKGDLL